MRIAITGSTGLVGSRIIELLKHDFEFIPLSQDQIDITDKSSISKVVPSLDFDLLLHLAAYTNVDGAEKERESAYKLNVEGTKNLFEASSGKKFIYISTDFVFDGQNGPFFEDSKPHPVGYYGQTKYEGEQVLEGNAMIVRISYPYRAQFEPKKDFIRTLKSFLEQEKELTMVTDSLMTPTFIDDIAYSLKYLMNNYRPEVFHIVGADTLSPYDAAVTIADSFGFDKNLIKKTTHDEYLKGKAPRPQNSDIRSKKNNFHKMKTFQEGLQAIKNQ